jgi:hypothetical protein
MRHRLRTVMLEAVRVRHSTLAALGMVAATACSASDGLSLDRVRPAKDCVGKDRRNRTWAALATQRSNEWRDQM